MIMIVVVLRTKPSGLYRQRRGLGLHRVGLQRRRSHLNRHACLPRQGESHPDTGAVFGLRIFTAHQSGPWLTGRTPEDPLVQDSLTYHRKSCFYGFAAKTLEV